MAEFHGAKTLRQAEGFFSDDRRRIAFDDARSTVGCVRIEMAQIGSLGVSSFANDETCVFSRTAIRDYVHFLFIETGGLAYRTSNGSGGGGEAGEFLTLNVRAGEEVTFQSRVARIGVSVAPDRLLEVVGRHFDVAPPRTIAFRPSVPASSARLRMLRDVARAILASDMESDASALLARRDFETALLASVVAGVPSNVSDLIGRADQVLAPAYVRRAVDFMQANLTADITLEDIANAATCSPRNLQITFRDTYGATPMRYLRKLRLDEAQRLLTSASGASATEIAIALGYTNVGRFAKDYRIMFGETPSHSMRRTGRASP